MYFTVVLVPYTIHSQLYICHNRFAFDVVPKHLHHVQISVELLALLSKTPIGSGTSVKIDCDFGCTVDPHNLYWMMCDTNRLIHGGPMACDIYLSVFVWVR